MDDTITGQSPCIEHVSFCFDYKIVTKTLTSFTLNTYHRPTSILLKYKPTHSLQILAFHENRPAALTRANHSRRRTVTIWLITNGCCQSLMKLIPWRTWCHTLTHKPHSFFQRLTKRFPVKLKIFTLEGFMEENLNYYIVNANNEGWHEFTFTCHIRCKWKMVMFFVAQFSWNLSSHTLFIIISNKFRNNSFRFHFIHFKIVYVDFVITSFGYTLH